MKLFQTQSLVAFFVLFATFFTSFAGYVPAAQIIDQDVENAEYLGTAQHYEYSSKINGKIVKEAYANAYMSLLNSANALDRASYLRTTADGIFLGAYGYNENN